MYGLITYLRNKLFDCGVLKTKTHSLLTVSIGNLKVGGTGKTPFVEHLLGSLASEYNIAVVSRGYGRKSKGLKIVSPCGSAEEFGDEPLQMSKKFPYVLFVVCKDRNTAIDHIEQHYPQINLVLLDDAYQHRYVARDINILLSEYTRPFFSDRVMPFGLLREYPQGSKRADYIVITKCPNLTEQQRKDFAEHLNPLPNQKVFFSQIRYKEPQLAEDKNTTCDLKTHDVILISGIANPKPLVEYIESQTRLLKTITFGDHHAFSNKDIKRITTIYENTKTENTILLTTEKDASRLLHFPLPLYVLPIETTTIQYPQNNQIITNQIKQDLCTIKSTKQQNTSNRKSTQHHKQE